MSPHESPRESPGCPGLGLPPTPLVWSLCWVQSLSLWARLRSLSTWGTMGKASGSWGLEDTAEPVGTLWGVLLTLTSLTASALRPVLRRDRGRAGGRQAGVWAGKEGPAGDGGQVGRQLF